MPGGQRDRFYLIRIWSEREMAGTAEGDCAARDADGSPTQSRGCRLDGPARRHPGRGAVVWGGAMLDRLERRWSNGARHHRVRTCAEWRLDYDGVGIGRPSRTDHYTRDPTPIARSL